jgi:hypothetical protein
VSRGFKVNRVQLEFRDHRVTVENREFKAIREK